MSHRIRSILQSVAVPVLAVVLSFGVGAILISVSGKDPVDAFVGLYSGALGDQEAMLRTLEKATPLIFNGLALTLAFQAGLFNIGVQGQFLFGAISSAAVGYLVTGLPGPAHMALALAAGVAAGALYGWLQGGLKALRGVHEVITGIMLNYVAINLTDYLTKGPLMDRAARNTIPRTPLVDPSCLIPDISGIPGGFVMAVLLALSLWYVLRKTVLGFEIHMVGANRHASAYAGVRVNFMVILIMAISGGMAGLGGAVETLGVVHRFQPGFNVGLGFEGITIALLARIHPLGVVPAALMIGAMKAGAGMMQFSADTPTEIIDMMFAMILFFVAADRIIVTLIPFLKTTHPRLTLMSGWGGK